MRIAFNFHNVGVGNNGGTRTVLKSAMALLNLGHQVEIWSDSPNQFTWFPLYGVEYRNGKIDEMPDVDVLIATGQASAITTAKFKRKKTGAYWVRGFETWAVSEQKLAKTYSLGLRMMANSKRLIKKIQELSGIKAELVRPGLEIDLFTPPDYLISNRLGALYSPKAMKRESDIRKVFRYAKNVGIQTVLMSAYDVPNDFPVDRIFYNPSEFEKRDMYRSVGIWYAPTDNDGLHLPPMEAGLCETALVAHGIPEAGMEDYAIHGVTALTYDTGDIETACTHVANLAADITMRSEMAKSLRSYLLENIGSREDNMARMVEVLS